MRRRKQPIKMSKDTNHQDANTNSNNSNKVNDESNKNQSSNINVEKTSDDKKPLAITNQPSNGTGQPSTVTMVPPVVTSQPSVADVKDRTLHDRLKSLTHPDSSQNCRSPEQHGTYPPQVAVNFCIGNSRGVGSVLRWRIRQHKKIDGSMLEDSAAHMCCPCCALMQENRELYGPEGSNLEMNDNFGDFDISKEFIPN